MVHFLIITVFFFFKKSRLDAYRQTLCEKDQLLEKVSLARHSLKNLHKHTKKAQIYVFDLVKQANLLNTTRENIDTRGTLYKKINF